MNYIKHLTGFFNRISSEPVLYPTHISLYMTLFQSWNVSRFKNPVTITRDEIMRNSRIASKATYHKCMKDLARMGFLTYQPTYNPYLGTQIHMVNLSDRNKSDIAKEKPASSFNSQNLPINEHIGKQTDEQLFEPNNIYKKTYKNINKQSIENSIDVFKKEKKISSSINEQLIQKNVEPAQKEKNKTPSLKKVKEYFVLQKNGEFEAERFFNYYSSNGWLIGGKTKMIDWKASANNWMLNTAKFAGTNQNVIPTKETPKAQNLHATTNKNYSEPL